MIRSPRRRTQRCVVSYRMARNQPGLPRPRRGTPSVRAKAAASVAGGPAAADAPAATPVPDDLRTVYGWLTRLAIDPADTERLLIEIVRRSRAVAPSCVRTAPEAARLQFLTVQSVLRLRGVL